MAHAAVAGSSQYVPVGPVRLVDTRENKGFTTLGADHPEGPRRWHQRRAQERGGRLAVVAVTNTTNNGFVTVWPAGEPMPLASNVNFERGQIVSNGLIVKLGAGGALSIYSSVPVDIVVDVTGAFVPGQLGQVRPVRGHRSGSPARLARRRPHGGRWPDQGRDAVDRSS